MALDRFGEEIVEDSSEPRPHRCDKGFVDRDADNPTPCLVCKPWLDPANRRRALLDADELRANRPSTEDTP